jgi:catechol 2,3-dioxygenase-like lactoylglutathione lyase family enzyme
MVGSNSSLLSKRRNLNDRHKHIGEKVANLTGELQTNETASGARAAKVDLKFEVVVVPVSDVDRAKEFYARLGWRFDIDSGVSNDYRLVQFTPPGSSCSIIFGKNVTTAAPGSVQGLYLIVSDIEAASKELLDLGVDISGPFHGDAGMYDGPDEPYLFGRRRVNGPDPNRGSYRSYASFRDPDGNRWLLQEVTTRLPGHMDPTSTTFVSVNDLAAALRRASAAHSQLEDRIGHVDKDWSSWCARYMVAEQSGEKLT